MQQYIQIKILNIPYGFLLYLHSFHIWNMFFPQVQTPAMRLAISSRLGSQSELQLPCLRLHLLLRHGTQNSELSLRIRHVAPGRLGRVLIMRDIN